MTVIKGVLIPADEATPMSVVELNKDEYTDIQQYVGGYFEMIEISPDVSVWVNEEGKIIGLPYNLRASVFVYCYRTDVPGYSERLAGDVLVLGGADTHGNTLSCPDVIIGRLVAA